MAQAPVPEARPDARRSVVVLLVRTTTLLVLLTFIYYVLPLRMTWSDPESWARLLASLSALGVLTAMLTVLVRRGRRLQPPVLAKIERLVGVLYLLVLGFAVSYMVVSLYMPGQFVGMGDRTDALYFTVTVLATVGFGDVHAAGNLARTMVTVQMLFNLVYLGTAVRVLSTMQLPAAVFGPPAAGDSGPTRERQAGRGPGEYSDEEG